MKNKIWMATLAMLTLCLPLAQAQDQGLGDMMFTAGTVKTVGGDEWAWLQWMATESTLLKDRAMDLYLKPGDALSVNPFTLKGRSMQVTDPRSIALLLARGETLGENLANLEGAVDSLYSGAEPVASLTLSEKLAALISGSQDDPELYQNLVFMGRAHPAVSMAIGQGFACKIPASGYSTFEVRDHNTTEVIGRITLLAGSPEVLPAPGPLLQLLEESPMGHLNVRLRWDIPTALKKVSLLQFGYNLYRMPKTYAEDPSRRYDLTPPAYDAMADLVDGSNVVKVNRMPIVVDAATAAVDAYFTIDDNNWDRGGSQFPDGAEYYYFISALDLLGRDGDLSDGLLASPFDRMAPGVPHGLKARAVSGYDGATKVRSQWIDLSWDHNPADTDVAAYYVYRHDSIADMQSNAVYAVSNRISGAIAPGAGETRIHYEDRSLGSNEWTTTYWYTVRSEDNSTGGGNLSGNSAPAYGVLRDWVGPPPSTDAGVSIQIESLSCAFDHTENFGTGTFKLTCSRPAPASPIQWAEFAYYAGEYSGEGSETNATVLGRYYFGETNSLVSVIRWFNPKAAHTIFCRVGSSSGRMSNYAHYAEDLFGGEIVFKGAALYPFVPTDSSLEPHVWGKYPNMRFPEIAILGVDGAETARIYRRIDGGRRTLIYQGVMPADDGALVVTNDMGGSVNGGTICYYYQLFDEHGNASPMVKIDCFQAEPRVDLPVPVLALIDSTGIATNSPGMELNWFCTVPGVQRFEVAVALDNGQVLPTFGGYDLQSAGTNEVEVVANGVTNRMNFGFYRTGRAGTTFGIPGSPKFELESSITLNRDYIIMVRAIGVTGMLGEWSNVEAFRWSTVPMATPEVPWPARGMPVIQEMPFHAGLEAKYLNPDSFHRFGGIGSVGIRIGEIPEDRVWLKQPVQSEIRLSTLDDPMSFLYPNAQLPDQTAMPFVIYRYQVPGGLFPKVSGDVVQVTPMMETIAYGTNNVTTIYDTYIAVSRDEDYGPWGLYVVDTQPVIRTAIYQYLLVRFDEETKEMDRIIPAGTVAIP